MLGVDIGTSSSKGVLVSPHGDIVASASRNHDVDRPWPGHVEMDATVWWHDVVGICRELLASAGRARVGAVGVSGMGPCTLLTTDDGTPVRPAILYGVDTRATFEIAELDDRYGASEIVARAGSALTSQAVGPKLAWVARHEPAALAECPPPVHAQLVVGWQLTGEYVLDHHSASQSVPLYDLARARVASADVGRPRRCDSTPPPSRVAAARSRASSAAPRRPTTGLPSGPR